MKKTIKTLVIVALLGALHVNAFSLDDQTTGRVKKSSSKGTEKGGEEEELVKMRDVEYGVFKTYDDYENDKPEAGKKYYGWSGSKFTYSVGDDEVKVSRKECPYYGFSDKHGILHRITKKYILTVLTAGEFTLYFWDECPVMSIYPATNYDSYEATIGSGAHNMGSKLTYYSITPNGEVLKFDEDLFENYLKKYDLYNDYVNDKQFEASSFSDPAKLNLLHKRIRWVDRLNRKIKAQTK